MLLLSCYPACSGKYFFFGKQLSENIFYHEKVILYRTCNQQTWCWWYLTLGNRTVEIRRNAYLQSLCKQVYFRGLSINVQSSDSWIRSLNKVKYTVYPSYPVSRMAQIEFRKHCSRPPLGLENLVVLSGW